MLNRFKLVLFAIILAVLIILFFQNQESISLKFLCSDNTSQYCLYQTPSISLAIWMAIFIVAGIFSSLVWQLLNRAETSQKSDRKLSSQSPRATQTRTSYREKSNLRAETNFDSARTRLSDSTIPNNPQVSDWDQRKSEDWEPTNAPNFAKNYNVPKQSPDMRREDTNYAYKFSKDKELNSPRRETTSQGSSTKENSNSESSKPPVSQNTEEVYDANYRTLNDVPPPSIPEDTEDDDSDWI